MGTHAPDTRATDAHTEPHIAIRVSLTAILGMPVTDAQGHLCGKLKDVAITTGPDGGKVAGLVLKTRTGLALVPSQDVIETPAGTLEVRSADVLTPLKEEGNFLFLQQDLVDRQIIDINGRKVVRVNDVDLEWMGQGAAHLLRVAEVEVGLRGAFRRVFKGVLPRARLEAVSRKFSARAIPWQFVDVIEPDPARRVRLRIEHERLADIHPSELADILEDLAPAEREAVFTSLDEEVAAETLEEVEPKLQKALLEKLDDERIADIVEEMDPGAAADLLSELPEEQSDAHSRRNGTRGAAGGPGAAGVRRGLRGRLDDHGIRLPGRGCHRGPGRGGAAQLRRRPGGALPKSTCSTRSAFCAALYRCRAW